MCPDCLQDVPIHSKEVCKKCYSRIYHNSIKKIKKKNWWTSIEISPSEKEKLRLTLLRYKWFNTTDIDIFVLTDFYLRFKAEWMPEYPLYNIERFTVAIKKELSKVFL